MLLWMPTGKAPIGDEGRDDGDFEGVPEVNAKAARRRALSSNGIAFGSASASPAVGEGGEEEESGGTGGNGGSSVVGSTASDSWMALVEADVEACCGNRMC